MFASMSWCWRIVKSNASHYVEGVRALILRFFHNSFLHIFLLRMRFKHRFMILKNCMSSSKVLSHFLSPNLGNCKLNDAVWDGCWTVEWMRWVGKEISAAILRAPLVLRNIYCRLNKNWQVVATYLMKIYYNLIANIHWELKCDWLLLESGIWCFGGSFDLHL